jgi:hypothetical protein
MYCYLEDYRAGVSTYLGGEDFMGVREPHGVLQKEMDE